MESSNPPNTPSIFRREWPVALVVLLPFIVFLIIRPSLPELVPMHFGAHGKVNRYGSPGELLILPGINVLLAILLYFIPRLDPEKANIAASMTAYRGIRFAVAALLSYIFILTLVTSLNPTFDVMPFVAVGLLVLFGALGFAMPGLKQNYMIGIRLPWTLDSDENWRLTHQFAGKLWVRGSLAGIVLTVLLPSMSIFIVTGVILTLVVSTLVYSYRLFQQESKVS